MSYTERFKKLCFYTLMGLGIGCVIGIIIGIRSRDVAFGIAAAVILGAMASFIISTKSGLPGVVGSMGVNWIKNFALSIVKGVFGGNIIFNF